MANIIISGFKEVDANLKKVLSDVQLRALQGMITSAILVKRDNEKSLPITPVDLGNLRASFFITTILGTNANDSSVFKGKKALKLSTDHISVIAQSMAEVRGSAKLMLIMGYSANYAVWVHEMLESTNWTRPGSGPKWFERNLKRNKDIILKIIGENAKISLTKTFPTTRIMGEHSEEIIP